MIYVQKYHFYQFPGGGIEENETHLETLTREIKEETGMMLIPDSVKEFGEVLKIQNGYWVGDHTIHVQQNFYYTCKVDGAVEKPNLDDGEKALGLVLKFVPIKEAIHANAMFKSDDQFLKQIAEREKRVLELLQSTQ